jgi:hypothetical protein
MANETENQKRTDAKTSESDSAQTQGQPPRREEFEMSGDAAESFRAAEGLSAGPEMNTHGTANPHPREPTGRHATDDWKRNKK